jgi:GntR family transcriptional regulator
VPITRQIADQIRAQCATGALPVGRKLPSIRGLARELAVNQNTILRVYERLSMEGLLELRHGDGTYVAARPPAGQLRSLRKLLQGDVERLVSRATSLGLGREELIDALDECFADIGRDGDAPEEHDDE